MNKKRHRKRRRPRFRRQTQAGAPPGTVDCHPESPLPVIHVTAFSRDQLLEEDVLNVDQLPDYLRTYQVTWIHVDGLGDADIIKRLGDLFDLHALALEDVVNVHQRAKVEEYDDRLFIVLRMVRKGEHGESEQLSLFLGPNFVLTLQDLADDCLDPVRERIRKSGGRMREATADYLAYALIDAVVDSYFQIVEGFADRLDALEEEMSVDQTLELNHDIHLLRNELLLLRRTIRPHRDAIDQLVRDEHPLIHDDTRVFLRDCHDHTTQLIELLDVYRELCFGLRDYYLTMVSNRTNEVMKVLTIIATIFIPLSFIAGIYGMNFDTNLPGNMPELHRPYGYIAVLGMMASIGIGLLCYFRRKGWLGATRSRS